MSTLDANGRIEKALRLLTPALLPLIEKELKRVYKASWQQNISSASGTDLAKLDAYAALKTILDNWQGVFRDGFKIKTRNDVSKALDGRNAISHASDEIPAADAISYLTAIRDIALVIPAKAVAEQIAPMIEDQIKTAAAAMGVSQDMAVRKFSAPQTAELDFGDGRYDWKPWRDVAPPHPDVMNARFVEAEFAADLSQVARGEGADTYRDAREFFRITFMTGGLRKVLSGAIERLAGKGGDPVIGLQTSFGGGKTHTMLALYHLASAKNPETLPGIDALFRELGISQLPVRSKPVVFVGTAAGVNQAFAVDGVKTVRTLWGLIAYRLGGWKAYERIKASDEARTNPGSEAMIPILREAAPCLILLDEVVAYARNLSGEPYDGFVTFIQSLTEAAKAVPGVLVVGSLPDSTSEVGDQRGRDALLALEKVFGRIQSAWAPAQGTETYEIIRRRLFQELTDEGEKARVSAVKAYVSFYNRNAADFPSDARDKAYEASLMAAYPVHPELFRVLQTDWSQLEKFQKTRGVLKVMAQIVYRLWRDGQHAPMIMPGDVPLWDDKVLTNALVPLQSGYDAVVAKEIAGDHSKAAQIEARAQTGPVGKSKAVTRAATALFMATSPHGTNNPGLEIARLRFACAIPGEQPSIFSEALRRLGENAAYLYNKGDHYWFSPQASLNQVAEDAARSFSLDAVHAEMIDVLRSEEKGRSSGFPRLHSVPEDPFSIEDTHDAALVILSPGAWHRAREIDSPAMQLAADITLRRGNGQRLFRNRLSFLAADQAELDNAEKLVRQKLAWQSISNDSRQLQLNDIQKDEVGSKQREKTLAAQTAIRRTWKHFLHTQEAQTPAGQARGFELEALVLSNPAQNPLPLPDCAWKKCSDDGLIVRSLGLPNLGLDLKKVWQAGVPHIAVKQLRDWYAQYPYLGKIRDTGVLATALTEAAGNLNADFGIASSFDAATQTYKDLTLGKRATIQIDSDAVLVERTLAARILGAIAPPVEDTKSTVELSDPVKGDASAQSGQPSGKSAGPPRPKRFYATVELDPSRPAPQVGQIAQSILSELERAKGTKIRIRLDIEAEASGGFPEDVESVVSDNAASLKFGSAVFERE